jgi:hypothetical protein
LPGRSSWQGAIDNLLRPVETGLFELQLGVSDEAGVTALREAEHRVLAIGAAFDATGYSAYRPDRSAIPSASGRMLGIDQAIDIAMSDPMALGRRVLIVDDGFDELAAGLAELLAARSGVRVCILSPRAWWGESLARTYDTAYVMPRLRRAGVEILTQHFVDRVEPGLAWIYELWQPERLKAMEADSVVLSLCRVARQQQAFESLATLRVGDCLAPRTIEAVIHEGEISGRAIS